MADQANPLVFTVTEYIDKEELTEASRLAADILSKAKEIEIADEATYEEALDILNRARQGKKYMNKQRLELTAPLNNYVGDINSKFKTKVAPLEEADTILSKKTSDYHLEKVRIQREEEARIEKERLAREAVIAAEQKIEDMKAAAEAREPEKIELPEAPGPEAVQVVSKTTETAGGSKITMRDHYDYEVMEGREDFVPRKYCSPDIKKIKRAFKEEGVQEIPGVKVIKTVIPAQSR